MSASKNLGKVFMTPKGIWDKNSNYTKLDIVTNKVGKISCGYIATTDIEKNIEITDNRWLKLFELLDGDLTEEYKAVQTDVTNKATAVNTNKKAVDLIYSQMQKLYDVEISTTTPTNERTGLWINPDDISGVINIPEIKDDEVSDVDTWSSKKIDNVTNSLKEDISTKITKFYASSQGETHLADSDNGKIQDMMLYGKSEQKQYSGKNLLNPTLQTTIKNGVTCTANGDGTYTLNGTATATGVFTLHSNIDFTGQMRLCGGTSLVSLQYSNFSNFAYEDKGAGIIIEHFDSVTYPNASFNILIKTDNVYNNALVKPMLTTDLTATYDDFEPYTGGIPSPNPDYPQEIKSVVNPTVKVSNEDETQFKTVTLPYTLNAIPVSSGGNVTIDGQQYIADYVDVERGKLVRHIKEKSDTISIAVTGSVGGLGSYDYDIPFIKNVICNITNIVYEDINKGWDSKQACISGSNAGELRVYLPVGNHNVKIIYELKTPEEIDLTEEEIKAFKALVAYYPTTNISINSEQLDGYTVFNYPISMANGWNYVKKQLNDNRDYIYDMDIQSAEAYVNSEYAVALTELEV